MDALSFANSQNTHVDGWSDTLSFELLFRVCAWSDERSIATSCEPRWMLISCVGAIMLRTTTVVNAGFFAPPGRLCGRRVTCAVGLDDCSVYGPLPAPTDAEEFSHCSALSAVD